MLCSQRYECDAFTLKERPQVEGNAGSLTSLYDSMKESDTSETLPRHFHEGDTS